MRCHICDTPLHQSEIQEDATVRGGFSECKDCKKAGSIKQRLSEFLDELADEPGLSPLE